MVEEQGMVRDRGGLMDSPSARAARFLLPADVSAFPSGSVQGQGPPLISCATLGSGCLHEGEGGVPAHTAAYGAKQQGTHDAGLTTDMYYRHHNIGQYLRNGTYTTPVTPAFKHCQVISLPCITCCYSDWQEQAEPRPQSYTRLHGCVAEFKHHPLTSRCIRAIRSSQSSLLRPWQLLSETSPHPDH